MTKSFPAPTPTAGQGEAVAPEAVRAVVLLIAAATLARLVLAGMTGLGVDESYMAGISREFSLSYLDHPPLHVWLAGLAARLAGSDAPLVLRLPFIALFAGTTWLMYRLTATAFGERAGVWAALLLNLAPVFALSTGSWVLPDGPMMFFVLAGAFVVFRVIDGEPATTSAARGWIAAGLLGGLALLSKYLAAFLFAGVFLFLLTSRPHRRLLASPGPWIGAAIAALMLAPVFIWNMENAWASFLFQGRRGQPAGFNAVWLLQDIGGQFGYLLPWIFLPLVYALARAVARGPAHPRSWFFVCLALPPIVIFTVMGLWAQVLPHWPMVGWLFAFPLLGAEWARLAETHGPLLRGLTALAAIVLLAGLALLASHAATGWINRVAPALLARDDPTLDVYDWRALKGDLDARGLLGAGTVVAATHWIDAGRINYALGGAAPVLCLCDDPHHFRFVNDPRRYAGRDILLVGTGRFAKAGFADRASSFDAIAPLAPITLTRGGQPAFVVELARGHRLRTSPP